MILCIKNRLDERAGRARGRTGPSQLWMISDEQKIRFLFAGSTVFGPSFASICHAHALRFENVLHKRFVCGAGTLFMCVPALLFAAANVSEQRTRWRTRIDGNGDFGGICGSSSTRIRVQSSFRCTFSLSGGPPLSRNTRAYSLDSSGVARKILRDSFA